MPLYEYQCQACGHEFEELQSFSDKAVTKCPKCGKNKVIKKISMTAFHLKGEGWYKDGYSRPSEKPKPKDKTTDKKPAAAKKSESKPAKTDWTNWSTVRLWHQNAPK